MKRLFSLVLALTLVLTVFGVTNVSAADPDVFMLYDGEGDAGNGAQNPWGELAGTDDMYFVEGTSSYSVQAFYDGLYFFQNTGTYLGLEKGQGVDLSGYDYIEFDIMSYYDMTCDLELSLVRNMAAHHGSDYEMFDMYLPAETFVHVKMPLKDFVTRSMDNRDKWDTENYFDPDDFAHFSGYAIDHVERLRFQFTYCKTMEGEPCDDIYIVFDNVTATKNGATHTHGGYQPEVNEIQTYEEYFTEDNAKKVMYKIDNLPNPLALTDEASVAEARTAYNALSDASKAMVTNYSLLTAAEATIAELKAAAAADLAAAQAVMDQIDALEKGDVEAIAAARAAYDALTDTQKALVNNLDQLEEMEKPVELDYGNVDGKGEPNAADALLILQSVVGKVELTADQMKLADVDGNGVGNAADALLVLQYTVGK
ncbi:MAG: dockerin type I repeat-containing protein, partial [Clostridia bacterium]|nr:dockerin type I repeat-containing protein [Clostridia bacterium]